MGRSGLLGHNYEHGRGDICKKCGQIHYNPFIGKKHSNTTKEKMSCRIVSLEIRQAQSKRMKEYPINNKAWKTRKEKYGKTGFKNTHPMKRPEVIAKFLGDNNCAKRPEVRLKRSMNVRGDKNPGKRPEVREKIKKYRSTQILPKKDTSIEIKLQNVLTEKNIEFKKHKTFKLFLGGYHQVDIFIEPNICVEVDGCFWHGCPIHFPEKCRKKDLDITKDLQSKGYIVLRFWEHDIKNCFDWCINQILETIKKEKS